MDFYSQTAIESTDSPPSLCLFKCDISSIKCSSCNYSGFVFFSNLLPQDSSAVLCKTSPWKMNMGEREDLKRSTVKKQMPFFFSLKYNCSTLLCYSLQHKEVNQLLHLGPPSQPTPIPPLQVNTEHGADLPVLYRDSHQLSISHTVVYICQP